jgi:hypothetical protein
MVDESGFEKSAARTHGYTRLGERSYGLCNWSSRCRTNAIGALLGKNLLYPSLFEQNINAKIFHC